MSDVSLLDCTLRDGGYVNNWNFGRSTTLCVIERMAEANIDVIEVGFLDERQPFDIDRTIQPDTESFNKVLEGVDRKNSMLVAMIDYGTCGLDRIAPCSESVLDGIRLIFKQPKMHEAIDFGRELTKLGYAVFLQMVSITSYTDRDLLDFVDLVNEITPYAVSMVDTYGLMHKEEMLDYFHVLDRNLKPEIHIGYHSHNNFQLAYANTCEMIKKKSRHGILVDGTAYGMGKSAGNAPLELLAMYMNEHCGKNYDLNQILEVIDTNIMRIYRQHYWGYNLLYFLSASNDCHPNYINYLLNKKTLSVKAINEVVKKIPAELKLNYRQECIENLYVEHQKQTGAVENAVLALEKVFEKKPLLILGPGKTILSERDTIEAYIDRENPVVIAVNFIPVSYKADFVFISNAKRYSMLQSAFKNIHNNISTIATSNITAIGKPFDYVLNYAELIGGTHFIEDNALVMLLKVVCGCSPASVALAGFDGFSQHPNDNYYSDFMEMSADYDRLSAVNQAIFEIIPVFREYTDVVFLTPSLYESEQG